MSSEFQVIKTVITNEKIVSKKIAIGNLFSIGTKGHYENPFTEILSYLFGFRNIYPKRDEFIKLFLKSLPNSTDDIVNSFQIEINIDTQYATNAKNFIDMVIYNGKYVLVFENKIEHWLANPLEDYESDISKRFSNLTPLYYVFSKYQTVTPQSWKNILIGNTFTYIQQHLKTSFDNKWDYYVNDFLNHYIPSKDTLMKEEEFDFYANNFSTVFAANNNVNDFISAVVEKIKIKLPDPIAKTDFIMNFGNNVTRAFRFYPTKTNKNNVVLVFKVENKISINIYYYKNPKQHLDNILAIVGNENYTNWTEGLICCFRRHKNCEFTDTQAAIDECYDQILRMKSYGT